jgi:hypothetical protein
MLDQTETCPIPAGFFMPGRSTVTASNARKPDPVKIAELETELGMEISPELTAPQAPSIVSLRSAINPPKDQRVDAFSINGVMYSILTRPKTNVGLKYIHLARTRGSEIAIDFMLEVLLGVDGYQALMDFDDLTEADLEAVIGAASKIMAGAVETPKDQPRNGSRKSRG